MRYPLASVALPSFGRPVLPGPTNTLLVMVGRSGDPRYALRLVAADTLGYATSISALLFLLAEFSSGFAFRQFFTLSNTVILAFSAVRLWSASAQNKHVRAVTFGILYVMILLGSKVIIFAYLPFPEHPVALSALVGHLAIVLVIVSVMAAGWVLCGANGEKFTALRVNLEKLGSLILIGSPIAFGRQAIFFAELRSGTSFIR